MAVVSEKYIFIVAVKSYQLSLILNAISTAMKVAKSIEFLIETCYLNKFLQLKGSNFSGSRIEIIVDFVKICHSVI